MSEDAKITEAEEEEGKSTNIDDGSNFREETSTSIPSDSSKPLEEQPVIIVIDDDEKTATTSALMTTSRKSNEPYSANISWEKYECEEFSAYRVLPNDMDLNGKSFAISGHFIKLDYRFNLGDIVQDINGRRLMFLGLRFSKHHSSSTSSTSSKTYNALLYFCPLNGNDVIDSSSEDSSFGHTFNKERIMKDLLLIQSVKMQDVFDKVDADKGLPYIQPSVDVVKTVMVQMRDVLLDYIHLSEIEANMPNHESTDESDDDEPSIDPRNKGKKTSSRKKKVISEPLRPLSIRNLGKVPLLNAVPATLEPRSKKQNVNDGIHNRSQLVSSSKKRLPDDEPNYSTEHLQLKTKEQLLVLCKSLNVSIPRGANKATIVELLANDDMRSSRVKVVAARAKESLGSISAKSSSQGTTALSPRYHDTTRESLAAVDQSQLLSEIGRALSGVENRISSSILASNVSEKSNHHHHHHQSSSLLHDELVAAKATLYAVKEHKKEEKEVLKEHVEIFGKISEATSKPIMEAMRLFSQTTLAAFERSASSTSNTPQQIQSTAAPMQIILPPSTGNANPSLMNDQLVLQALMQHIPQQQHHQQLHNNPSSTASMTGLQHFPVISQLTQQSSSTSSTMNGPGNLNQQIMQQLQSSNPHQNPYQQSTSLVQNTPPEIIQQILRSVSNIASPIPTPTFTNCNNIIPSMQYQKEQTGYWNASTPPVNHAIMPNQIPVNHLSALQSSMLQQPSQSTSSTVTQSYQMNPAVQSSNTSGYHSSSSQVPPPQQAQESVSQSALQQLLYALLPKNT